MKNEKIDLWLGKSSGEALRKEAIMQLSTEKKERLLKDDKEGTDYGYSFPGIDRLNLSCLSEINAHFEKTGERPMVLDIGAGLGNMTWKLLAAGAKVDAIELQSASALEISKRLNMMNKQLWRGEILSDIVKVQAGDALALLEQSECKEKYDYVWCSQVIHFMTPEQIRVLKQRLNHVLKPGGKVFMMANYVYQFNFADDNRYVEATYKQAKNKTAFCPGFMSINMATLIDPIQSKIVDCKVLSAYNLEQMTYNDIPIEVNAYCKGELSGPKQNYDFGTIFENSFNRLTFPSIHSVNKFYQTMNFFEPEAAKTTFKQSGFDVTSFTINALTDRKPLDKSQTTNIGTIILMEKDQRTEQSLESEEKKPSCSNLTLRTSLDRLSLFFEPDAQDKVQFKITNIADSATKKSLQQALKRKDFSLLLRRSCAYGILPMVTLLLENKEALNIDVNKTSSNGNSALDWIRLSSADKRVISKIESLLIENGAKESLSEGNILN